MTITDKQITAGGQGGSSSQEHGAGVGIMAEQMMQEAAGKAIPAGYKQTEVGIIPEDWEVDSLGNLCRYQNGKAQERHFNSNDGYKVVSIGNYSESGKYIETGIYIDKKFKNEVGRFILNRGDLAMILNDKTAVGTIIGRVLLIEEDDTYVINQRTMRLTPQEAVTSKYLHFSINSDFVHKRIVGMAKPGTQIYVNTDDVLCFYLPMPSSEKEQTAIANVLSDSDELIDALEQLIAKKQAIKSATMQQLLTGRTRLPAFALRPDGTPKGYKPSELGDIPEDWEVKQIGNVAPLQRGFDLPANMRIDGRYPVVYSNGVVNTHNTYKVNGPGVVTGRSGTLGKVHYVEHDFWPHNTSLWVMKFNNSDIKFIYYLFSFIGFERFASGSGVPTLNRNDAHLFKISIPTLLKEQTAIATILSDMDNELQALTQKLEKARALKQGMMQQLLTGKIRLPLAAGA